MIPSFLSFSLSLFLSFLFPFFFLSSSFLLPLDPRLRMVARTKWRSSSAAQLLRYSSQARVGLGREAWYEWFDLSAALLPLIPNLHQALHDKGDVILPSLPHPISDSPGNRVISANTAPICFSLRLRPALLVPDVAVLILVLVVDREAGLLAWRVCDPVAQRGGGDRGRDSGGEVSGDGGARRVNGFIRTVEGRGGDDEVVTIMRRRDADLEDRFV
jgi:hypothetical protein